MEGWFKAVECQDRGAALAVQDRAPGSSANRSPIGGRTGTNMWRSFRVSAAGRGVLGDLDPRDATAALGFVNAMKDLKDVTTPGGTLYVFRLP